MSWDKEEMITHLKNEYVRHWNKYHHFQRNDNEVDANYESAACDILFDLLTTFTEKKEWEVADELEEQIDGVFLFDPQAEVYPITEGTEVYAAQDILYSDLDSFNCMFDEDDLNYLADEVMDVNYYINEVSVPKGTKMTFKGTEENGWPIFDIHGFEFDFAGAPFKLRKVK